MFLLKSDTIEPLNRKEKQFCGLGQLETSSTLTEISKKSVAICVIGQNYEGKFSKIVSPQG